MQLVRNTKDLLGKDPKNIIEELKKEEKSNEVNSINVFTLNGSQHKPVEIVINPQSGTMDQTPPEKEDSFGEYDIISSERSDSSGRNLVKLNGHSRKRDSTIRYSRIEFDTVKEQPKYVVSKSYTAKRKDEIFLPLGTEVGVADKKDNRSFVIAHAKDGQELDRGWVPSFALQLKEEAVEITSKEGLHFCNSFFNFWIESCLG